MKKKVTLATLVILGLLASSMIPIAAEEQSSSQATKESVSKDTKEASSEKSRKSESLKKIVKSDKEWRKQLSRMQYRVTRQHATERARTGRYWNHKAKGTYVCVCCDLPLFSSKTKFKSGTGWPSFYAPLKKQFIGQTVDRSLFSTRMEVHCNRCDAHLGHVFSDGPRPTGLRYCINSASLKFESDAQKKRKESKTQEKKGTEKESTPSSEAKAKTKES